MKYNAKVLKDFVHQGIEYWQGETWALYPEMMLDLIAKGYVEHQGISIPEKAHEDESAQSAVIEDVVEDLVAVDEVKKRARRFSKVEKHYWTEPVGYRVRKKGPGPYATMAQYHGRYMN